MKNLPLFMIFFLMISCANKKSVFTDGEWIENVIYTNETKTDSIVINDRVKFLKSGEIMENKYRLGSYEYKVSGEKFYFLKSDTVTATYEIIHASKNKIVIEAHLPSKYNKRDTILYRQIVYKKTNSLPDKPYDACLYELAKLYDIGKADTLGDGTIFYNFDAKRFTDKYEIVYDNPSKSEIKIKGIIDKILGVLPKKEEKDKFSEWCMCLKSSYEWETLDLLIKMENDFKKDYKDKLYLNSRIWITVK
jgi:hypothetical protein